MLEHYKLLATKNGGQCLSDVYINSQTPLLWKCGDCEYEWLATPNSIQQGSWCRLCSYKNKSNERKPSLEQINLKITRFGILCTSKKYIKSTEPLNWECLKAGHRWTESYARVKRKRRCPECSKSITRSLRPATIEKIQNIVAGKGGKVISFNWVSNNKLRFQCAKGHIWETKPANIKIGRWCHICAGNKKLTLADLQEIAEMNGGECLAREYINNTVKIPWKCKRNHKFSASPARARQRWCRSCSIHHRKN